MKLYCFTIDGSEKVYILGTCARDASRQFCRAHKADASRVKVTMPEPTLRSLAGPCTLHDGYVSR
jgi:hypothetical protein